MHRCSARFHSYFTYFLQEAGEGEHKLFTCLRNHASRCGIRQVTVLSQDGDSLVLALAASHLADITLMHTALDAKSTCILPLPLQRNC